MIYLGHGIFLCGKNHVVYSYITRADDIYTVMSLIFHRSFAIWKLDHNGARVSYYNKSLHGQLVVAIDGSIVRQFDSLTLLFKMWEYRAEMGFYCLKHLCSIFSKVSALKLREKKEEIIRLWIGLSSSRTSDRIPMDKSWGQKLPPPSLIYVAIG